MPLLTDNQEKEIAIWFQEHLGYGYEFDFNDPIWMEEYVHEGELTYRDMFDIMVEFANTFDVKKMAT